MTTTTECFIVGGVDPHKDRPVAAVIDTVGRLLGTEAFPTTAVGYARLVRWMQSLGSVQRMGIEGTSSYGTRLTRFVRAAGIELVEVHRLPRVQRRLPMRARPQAANQLHAIIASAPDMIRARLRDAPMRQVVSRLQWRRRFAGDLERIADEVLRGLSTRWSRLSALLVVAGDNPDRLRSESAFAALCGAAPLDGSSGRQQRHRLSRSGNRDANRALWVIAFVRLRIGPDTKVYMAKRWSEGRSTLEAIRCLKRHIAREVCKLLPPLSQMRPRSTMPA